MSNNIKLVSIPPVPKYLIDHILDIPLDSYRVTDYHINSIVKSKNDYGWFQDKSPVAQRYFYPSKDGYLHKEIRALVSQISDNCDIKIAIQRFSNTSTSSSLFPHIDAKNRKAAFNFYIDCGGTETKNIFYNLKDEHLDKKIPMPPFHYTYDWFNIIEECTLKPNNWYLLKSDVPHGVENITSDRITIGIDFLEDFNYFLSNHSNILGDL